jgi:ribose 1,5-bisphosphate isomerase
MNELDHYYKKMIKNAADHLPDGSIVITICHSSSVTGALKKAYEDGKEIKVISCETRPLYQGRITTRELAEAGIEVTHIVDSEAATYIKKCDSAFVGADAVNAEGDLYNKVGTRMLAELCSYYRVPFHPIMELLKFDPLTILGYTEVIEQRDPKEIWDNPPKNVKVLNPAFDHVPASLIKSYITEEGLLHPFEIKSAFEKKYKMVFDN